MRDITRELRVGTCCGKCLPEAKAALTASLEHRNDSQAAELRMSQRMESAGNAFFGNPANEFAV